MYFLLNTDETLLAAPRCPPPPLSIQKDGGDSYSDRLTIFSQEYKFQNKNTKRFLSLHIYFPCLEEEGGMVVSSVYNSSSSIICKISSKGSFLP